MRELVRAAAIALIFSLHGVANAGPPEGLVPPVVQNEVEIEYPAELLEREAPPGGTVTVKLVVGVDGSPHSLEVVESVDPVLDALVLTAASGLRYEPAKIENKPVEVVLRIGIELHPPQAPPPALEPDATPEAPVETGLEPEADAGPIRLAGRVLEAGQRTPVSGASIVVVPADPSAEVGKLKKKVYATPAEPAWQRQVYTDDKGAFTFRDLPAGKLRVVILAEGFERLEYVESLPADQTLAVRYWPRRLPDNPYRTVVRSRRPEREEVTRRTINVQEINNLPGTQGDALKAIQNFPGISRAPFGIGLLVVRGADPTDSAVYLAEHEIPQLFHFGGITSVFNADILSEIDYIPGNFDSRWGDAIGGVIDVKLRQGRRDGYHGYIDSDLFDTGLLFEGPVGKGSFILSARRSYIDLLLPAVIPDDAGLELAVAPRYYDYQALFDYPISSGNLAVHVFGSDDRTRLIASDPNEVETDDRDRFETTIFFHRVDFAYDNHVGAWDFLFTPSYRFDRGSAGIGDLFRFTVDSHLFSARAEAGRRLAKRLRIDFGTQIFAGAFAIDAEAPPVPVDGVGSANVIQQTESFDTYAIPILYATASIGLGDRFTLYPGARLSYYAILFNRASFDPRLRAVWQVGDQTAIKGGVGLYSQIPDAFEWNPTYGNPRVAPDRALHVSGSVSRDFAYDITVEVSGFYKYLWDLASQSLEIERRFDGQIGPESFASHGAGRIWGGELFIRKDLTRSFFGWVSYTLSRSERRTTPEDQFVLFALDQTHILTLIAVYRFPRNWQVGARFRVVSGNPFTPVSAPVYDANTGEYIPISDEENSGRVPVFHQLDLRIDKKWIWKRVMLNLYLDVQNAYNRQNAEFMNYGYDFRNRQPITSLPIIPSLGAKLEF